VYVLTSPVTISAAEEVAYDLQALGRAKVVGATTAGAAHLTASGPVGPHLFITISIARPIAPVTQSNWEGIGVIPDIKVSASDALRIAQERIR
jgi:C-terminal processing protease CtpA/Prc